MCVCVCVSVRLSVRPSVRPSVCLSVWRAVTLVSKVPNSHRDGPPEPGILLSVLTLEAMQLLGVSKVATLAWMGYGFGLRRAELLTLNPEPFHISIHLNPKQPHHPHHREGQRGLNSKPEAQNPPPHHTTEGERHHTYSSVCMHVYVYIIRQTESCAGHDQARRISEVAWMDVQNTAGFKFLFVSIRAGLCFAGFRDSASGFEGRKFTVRELQGWRYRLRRVAGNQPGRHVTRLVLLGPGATPRSTVTRQLKSA